MDKFKERKLPSENTSGVLRVDVEPISKKKKNRFIRFKKWIYDIFGGSDNAERIAKEYVEAAVIDQLERLRKSTIENQTLEKELEFRNRQNQMSDLELQKKAIFAPHELDLVQAQAEKIKAEAEAIRTETKLKAMEKLNEIGVDILPILENGKLVGFYASSDKRVSSEKKPNKGSQ